MSLGRKSKLNKTTQDKITSQLYKGLSVDDACDHAGISNFSFYAWLHRGKNEKSGIYHDFRKAVMEARQQRGFHRARTTGYTWLPGAILATMRELSEVVSEDYGILPIEVAVCIDKPLAPSARSVRNYMKKLAEDNKIKRISRYGGYRLLKDSEVKHG